MPGKIGGEGGIRTPGPFRVNGFQDRRFRPLSHLSFIFQSASSYTYLPGINHHFALLTPARRDIVTESVIFNYLPQYPDHGPVASIVLLIFHRVILTQDKNGFSSCTIFLLWHRLLEQPAREAAWHLIIIIFRVVILYIVSYLSENKGCLSRAADHIYAQDLPSTPGNDIAIGESRAWKF